MHIVNNRSRYKGGKKIYSSVLLMESYREKGKVKKRTVANLSHCSPQEIAAIKLALKYKDDLTVLGSINDSIELKEGLSIGAVWTIYQLTKGLGIEKVLGNDFSGKLARWQVIARVINQGSRLSAVRLAETHALSDVLQLDHGFDENALYENLSWIADNQARIEKKLFLKQRGNNPPELFFLRCDKLLFRRRL